MPGEAILVFVLQTLKEKWIEHKDLKDGERRELEQLDQDLQLLLAFLKNSALKSDKNDLFRQYEMRITDLVYEVEDTIATCLAEKAVAKTKIFIRVAQKLRINMAKQVKFLREHKVKPIIQAINNEIGKIVVGDGTRATLQNPLTEGTQGGSSTDQPWVTFIQNPIGESSSSQDQSNKQDRFVAFEDEETIIGYLLTESSKLDVICISGMPGIGKTTLAQKVFEHTLIADEFPLRIWIRVSQRFNSRDAFLDILKRFTPKASSAPSDHNEVISTVAACLRNKKFLIVVDDLWTVRDWDAIEAILPMDNWQGKVLVTSRENGIAGRHLHSHKLNGLGSEASLKLLRLKVFGLQECPTQLEDVLQVIANNCGEVPLIILAIGAILKGILTKRKSIIAGKEEWLEVSKNVNLFLHNESSRISDVVELSYSILSGDLKGCFLYMGVFPEDYEISVWTLTRLWIAEGFVKPNYGQSLEDKAVQNLDDLITKNLVMVEKIYPIGEVKTCRLHNMIRGFCVYKAREHNLFQEIKRSEEGVLEPPLSQLQNSRRLCLHSNDNTLLSQLPYIPRIRSILSFNELSSDGLDRSSISTILGAFKLLKVLAIKLDHQQPPRLTKLFHLTFITLSVEDLSVLPESLSKLWNLQTLVVDTKSRLITIEANIWKMIWLRHLKTNATIVLSRKGGEGKGGDLQTLSRLLPECTPNVCERARNLKTLGIRGNLDNLFKYSLKKMHRLQKLKLVNESFQELHQFEKLKLRNESILHELLHYFPPNITRLTLSKTFLQWDHMSILANIETLEVLKLKDNAFIGIYWSAAKYSFPRLGFLLISDTDLVHWEASSNSLPNLRFLVLKKCENLNEIPWAVAENHLEKLDIEYVGESAVQSAMEIAEQKKHAEDNEPEKKANRKHGEEDEKAEITNSKHAEENEKVEKVNWRSSFKLVIGPGCYQSPIAQPQIKRAISHQITQKTSQTT